MARRPIKHLPAPEAPPRGARREAAEDTPRAVRRAADMQTEQRRRQEPHVLRQGQIAELISIPEGRLSEYARRKRTPQASTTFEAGIREGTSMPPAEFWANAGLQPVPVVRDVATTLWTWGFGRPCGPQ